MYAVNGSQEQVTASSQNQAGSEGGEGQCSCAVGCRSTTCCRSSVSCGVCGSWALNTETEAFPAMAKLSHGALVKPLTSAGKLSCETLWTAPSPCLCYHQQSALSHQSLTEPTLVHLGSTLHHPAAWWTAHTEGAQLCRGADTHFTPVCSSRTPRLPACSWQHSVTCAFITNLSVTTVLKKHLSSQSDWGWLISITNKKNKITISLSASPSSCLDCTMKSLLIWWRTSLEHTSSFIMIRTSQCTFAISVSFKLQWAELPMQRFDLSWNSLISISLAYSFMFEALWNTGNSILS